MIVVPEEFATATVAREGNDGREWIVALPDLVRAFCERWGLVVEGAPMHGYLGLVVPVSRGGEPCALKIAWPDESAVHEAAALVAWGGRGAVRLLEVEQSLGAMLLERLDSSRTLSELGIEDALVIAGRLLRRLAITPPDGLPLLRDVARDLARNLTDRWERYGRPMPRSVLEQARDLALQLGPSSGALLVNYDLHYADVLAGTREPWLVVDPRVVAGDLEYGVAQLLWRRLEDIEEQGGLDRHFHALVEAAQLDYDLTRSWSLVRCVDYWLWGLSIGLTYDPARCARIVDWLA